ncbi:MAG: hypothetical protein IJU28_01675 [Clostridia bacterium]|nr:hypothetical protein [Clostridia bacterium]
MYKRQVKLQKVICLISLVSGACVFIYALGLLTDLYTMLYTLIPDPEELDNARVAGARIYYDMQPFNRQLLYCGIALLLLACTLFITRTSSRRKYYVGNYISSGLNIVSQIAAAVWIHIRVSEFKNIYLTTVDFAQLERRLGRLGTYTDSTFWFDIHYAVCALSLVAAVLLILNMLWKVKLMHDERSLIGSGKAASL